MWKLTIEDDEGKRTPLPLLREEYSIGRGEENTVRLTERNISRKHAFLRRNGSGWVISDSASYNGSYVNGVRIVGDYTIAQGDIVQVGDYRLVFHDEESVGRGDTATATTAPGAGPSAAKPDRLVIVVGPEPGQEFLIQAASIVIGRAPELDITIAHSSVSRVHAEVHALGGGRYEVIDKASANGVRVNGSLLKRGLLEAGDFIELGEVKLKFVGAGQIYRPGPEAMRLEPQKDDGAQGGLATVRPPPPSGPVFGTTANIDGFANEVGGRSKLVKNLFVGALLGLVVVGGFFAFRRFKPHGGLSPAEATASRAPAPVDPARAALDEAKELAAQGDLDLAHARIATDVATSAALRDGSEVRDIEGRWADAVLARAEQEQDVPTRRMLLNAVAQSTTVDAGRRRTAADKLKEVDYLGTDIHELPQAAKPQTTAANQQNDSIPSKLPKPILAADPWSTPAAAPSPKTRPAPPAPAPAPEPTTKANELALQGPEGEAKARAQLEAKVSSGRASVDDLKLLRAICQHSGDRACRDRASELLRQQK
jgi:pSer/pThr/pTyr-binding forkhead associated (FHA) protein